MRPKSSLPTQPTLSNASTPACQIVALLEEERRIIHRFPEHGGHVTIGRSQDCDIYIDDTRISREHAYIERLPDRIIIRARRRVRVDSVDVAEASLRPGDRFDLRGLGFTVFTEPMAEAYPALEYLVGDPRIVRDLLTMPRGKHAVLLGVEGAPLLDIARCQHAALVGADARLVEASLGASGNPRVPDVETLLPEVVNGRIYIDGRKRDAKGKTFAPHLALPLLERLARPEQRTALTLALHDLSDVDTNVVRRGCANFLIPPITDRLRSEAPFDRDNLIETTFARAKYPLLARHLHPDFIARVVRYDWPGDYKAFEAVVYYATFAWLHMSEGADQLHKIYRRLTTWLRDSDLTWERLRELPPDVRVTRRISRSLVQ